MFDDPGLVSLETFFWKGAHLACDGFVWVCTHKTVAMGIPLINAIYDGNPAIALYTLPLLIWHPMQLVVGTFLSPRLFAWVVDEEKKNRGSNDDDDDNDDDDNGDENVYDNDDGTENVNEDMLDSSHT
mmetsp:Transcript_18996/g.20459  ORF Transcript_18996/g.20459 Transcript_18996/m.20459 type:complete len:128 (+) Transcript_18996:329-712(+)